jgi:ParB/RepB/Spo0J family partition protein
VRWGVREIAVELVQPSSRPVRASWDEGKMGELVASIRQRGVIVPVKVRPLEGGRFEIVFGHRRFEACRRLGLATVPAIVGELEDGDALVEQVIENELREDLPYLERAQALERVLAQTGWSRRELARRVGISHATVNNALAWLESRRLGAAVPVDSNVHQGDGVGATLEIARELGEDVLGRQVVAAKVAEEGLGQADARKLARAYRAAEDGHERESVIEVPFKSLMFGRAVRVKADVRRERELQERKRREEDPREVRHYLDAVREYQGAVREAVGVARWGKFSPEAVRFVKEQHARLRKGLEEVESAMDGYYAERGGA